MRYILSKFVVLNTSQEITTVRATLKAAVCIFFIPFLTVVYNQKQLIKEAIYVTNKEIIEKIHGFYNQEQVWSSDGHQMTDGHRMVVRWLSDGHRMVIRWSSEGHRMVI